MELTIYDIIKGPVVSSKAYRLNSQHGQLVIAVHIEATRPMIKQALEELFDVKVKKVRTLIAKYTLSGGTRKRRISRPKIKEEKRAVVTLAEGYSLDLFEHVGAASTSVAQDKQQKKSAQGD